MITGYSLIRNEFSAGFTNAIYTHYMPGWGNA